MRSAVISGLVVLVAALGPPGIASAAATPPSAARGTVAATGLQPVDQVFSVRCVASNKCVAVGSRTLPSADLNPLVAIWNGQKWTDTMLPEPAGGNTGFLFGVSCGAPTSCVAVGDVYFYARGQQVMLVESWNGKAWRRTLLPTPAGHSASLRAVSCAKPTACMAVGDLDGGTGHDAMIAEWWNGRTWTRVKPPVRKGFSFVDLSGVSCTAVTRCVAVGDYGHANGAGDAAVAEYWNGKSWADATLPAPAHRGAEMSSVTCVSAASCVAVGSSDSHATHPGPSWVLAESWNGKTWKVMAAPTPEPGSGLSDVSCVSARSCTAVGSWTRGFDELGDELTGAPIAESWNGKTWVSRKVPGPIGTADGDGSALYAVSCPAVTRCLAVGQAEFGESIPDPAAELWTGQAWKIVPAP